MISAFRLAPIALLLTVASSARGGEKKACADAASDGQDLRGQVALRAARDAFLECAKDECPAVVRRDCIRWLREVEDETPSLVPIARDASGIDLGDVTISVDDAVVPALSGKALEIDPGPHVVRFVHGGMTKELRVVAHEGERSRRLVVVFESPALPPPLVTVPDQPSPRPSRTLPTVVAAAGAVLLGASLYLGIHEIAEADALRSSCAPGCPERDVSDVKTRLLLADVGVGVGVVALAIATVLWITATPGHTARDR